MTKEIPLSRGLVAQVDDADYEQVMAAGSWHVGLCGGRMYAQRYLRRPGGRPGVQRLHTFLTGWSLVDHHNADGLDNRRANLREATGSQNNANARRPRSNTSGFKGVGWYARTGRWRACLGVNGRQRHLGYFRTAEEAARAYDDAAIEVYGEFARPNFPREISA